ncbi:hypothetical protein [Streptomyces sp. IB2014 016-6]|uniref:hypothetical protein n=1 Tax=Streptomyces sp. IB2014 016-6 TaxID=2517818 RepID=UPI0011CBFA1C|nr:hypothetical protein [Streptomyces sp. IB2014 016-6]TXL83943.1 hypothetical protein EW053_35855 [Streptomyces sp. IB2014 016-6]
MNNLMSPGSITGLPALLAAGIAVTGVLALAVAGWTSRRRTAREPRPAGSPAVKVAALAAVGCTAYSADTSWRFAADYLDMAGTIERAAMFGAAELALFATALMARQNLNSQGTPGLPGTLVWVITGVQIIPAYAESGPVGGTVRAFVGPVMAAMLWHLAMGIELRLHKPDAASQGLLASLGREARERLLSRLGIAARDRDAAQITRDRATARAVTLATCLAEHTPAQRQKWRGRRLTRKLSKALGRAAVATDPKQRAQLLDQLAARRHAHTLATVPLPSPWTTGDDDPGGPGSATVPAPQAQTASVPGDDPRTDTEPIGDRTAGTERGPVPDNPHHNAGTDMGTERGPVPESRYLDAGTGAVEPGTETGTGAVEPEPNERPNSPSGTERFTAETPAHTPQPHRGPTGTSTGTDGDREPTGTETGTRPTGDRGPTGTGTGTDGDREPSGDRGPKGTESGTGTEPTGDRGPKETESGTSSGTGRGGDRSRSVPARRKPKGKGKRKRSRAQQAKGASRGSAQSVEQLVTRVRPHVPALLERDGNETVSRVQLREILRQEGLRGGRNDRLGLVLQQLRTETTTNTTTRSSR